MKKYFRTLKACQKLDCKNTSYTPIMTQVINLLLISVKKNNMIKNL